MLHEYIFASSIDAALALLAQGKGKNRIIAGGTDLVLQKEWAGKETEVLVDLSKISNLSEIHEENGWLSIGANVTHNQAAFSPLIREKARALADACSKVGGKQVRNIATLAGNVVTALPAADAAVALTALGALCRIRDSSGASRDLPMTEMYRGVAQSAIDSRTQILTHIRIPVCGAGCGSSYMRMEQRKALSLPMLCVAVRIKLEGGAIQEAGIAMAPVGPAPKRAGEAEAFLIGKKAERAVFQEAAALACSQASFRSSAVRGSKEFRHAVLPVFIVRGLEEATQRAAATA